MNHRDAFLRDIIEHPEDDAPRLIFADWLEDNGDPDRAEFIRVQCELDPLSRGQARWEELTARSMDLWSANHVRWVHELPVLPGVKWGPHERGFAATILFAHGK